MDRTPRRIGKLLTVDHHGGLACFCQNRFPEHPGLRNALPSEYDQSERDQNVFRQPLTDHEIGESGHRVVNCKSSQALTNDDIQTDWEEWRAAGGVAHL